MEKNTIEMVQLVFFLLIGMIIVCEGSGVLILKVIYTRICDPKRIFPDIQTSS